MCGAESTGTPNAARPIPRQGGIGRAAGLAGASRDRPGAGPARRPDQLSWAEIALNFALS